MEYFSKILHIDINENAQSIAERFISLEDTAIIFTIPARAQIFQNVAELKLLKQAIDASGKNIVLVSQDEAGLEMAHDLGFKVEREFLELLSPQDDEGEKYEAKTHLHPKIIDIISSVPLNKMAPPMRGAPSEKQLPETGSDFFNKQPEGRKETPRKKSPVLIAVLIFIAVSLTVGGISAATLLPSATIKITPKKEIASFNLPIVADKSISQIDISQNKIPLQIITAEKELTLEFPSTGKTETASKAGGKIVAYNTQDAAQKLVATTRFESSGGKIFRTKTAITIPANGSLEVEVVADKTSAEYNIGPSDFKIPGFSGNPKYNLVYGKSTVAMSGGASGAGNAVSAENIENARQKIKSQLAEEAKNELMKEREELPSAQNLYFIEGAIDVRIIDEKISATAGTLADKFSITTKISTSAFLFEEKSLDEIIKETVKTKITKEDVNLGEIRKIFSDIKTDFPAGTLSFNMKAEQDVYPAFDIAKLQNIFAGKNGEQIREYILSNDLMEGAEISFWPRWVKKAPKNPNKIEIIY